MTVATAIEGINDQSYGARIQVIADLSEPINGAQYCSRDVSDVLLALYDAERFFTDRYKA